jgi:2-haloacid dehalogenase
MKGKRKWPKAIFYDSKNTLFAWDSVWIKACSNILTKYESNMDPEVFWRQWATFLTGENQRTAFGKFRKFTESLRVSLLYAFKYFGIAGSPEDVRFMTDLWKEVQPFPDTLPALTRQQELTKILIYSNVETEYLEMMVNKLVGFRPDFLGDMDKSQSCKPSPRAYRWVLENVGLKATDVIYCAGPQWDVQGAMAFGMKGAWVHRPYRFSKEIEGVKYDYEVNDLHELTKIIESSLSEV